MAQRKIPMRMCTACREMKPKAELIRIVKTPEGTIKLDFGGRLNGRGAYICKSRECMERAAKLNSLSHAFSQNVPAAVYEELMREFEALNG